MSLRASVIISTYNKPRELELVLCGLQTQLVPPHEVLIADDGSGDETKDLIQRWASHSSTPIRHIWH